MVDQMKIIPISTLELGSGDLDDIVPLSEYKFDRSSLVVVKRTPKRWKVLVSSLKKPITEGFKESTIWNILGLDVTQVGVETSVVITETALAGQTSIEAMAKEITWLKHFAVQFQVELMETVKTATKEKKGVWTNSK